MSDHDGGPAFPQPVDDLGTLRAANEGMSLRDWYAGMAIQAIISGPCMKVLEEVSEKIGESSQEVAARMAFEIAGAMLKEREAK